MQIREATPSDASIIARVHVDSWRTTYKGIMPDEVIASRSYEQREQLWARVLMEQISNTFVYVAENNSGDIVGFVSGGPNRDEDSVYTGELHAIYILESHQGKGVGHMLVSALSSRLLKEDLTSMMLWVLADNYQARRFYENLGGKKVAERQEAWGDNLIGELAYGWDDIASLTHLSL